MLRHDLPKTLAALPNSEAWFEHSESETGANSITLHVRCPECGKEFSRSLSPTELSDVELLYEHEGHHPDGHVQDVFPDWSCDERELFLMSHLCGGCWKAVFGEEDE